MASARGALVTLLLSVGTTYVKANYEAWCNAHTCTDERCVEAPVCAEVRDGTHCAAWCNLYTCGNDVCKGCDDCQPEPPGDDYCYSWCSSYTCGMPFGACSSCTICKGLAAGAVCSPWCNAYTCNMQHCAACSSCGIEATVCVERFAPADLNFCYAKPEDVCDSINVDAAGMLFSAACSYYGNYYDSFENVDEAGGYLGHPAYPISCSVDGVDISAACDAAKAAEKWCSYTCFDFADFVLAG